MSLLIEVKPNELPLNVLKTDASIISKNDKYFKPVDGIDLRGYWTFMPLGFFISQLIPVVGIVTGSMAIAAAQKNKRLIIENTSIETFKRSSAAEIRLTQAFGVLAILGLALPVFLVACAVVAIATIITAILVVIQFALLRLVTLLKPRVFMRAIDLNPAVQV
ncbi:hypothetical protein [Chlamydiifrater phoenicopteri]|uniref:hypothetical protein n=1 Tax=Chlamydiifrater phoenicopteri TaxID=2681469 RepID=UPI001BCBF4B0|nr:hypothetical protein [Chlamydiifrater phoenicopteri]